MTNAELEKKVRSLETTRAIVIAVALIFGISGAWGGRILADAKKQLASLADPVGQFNDAKEKALQDFSSEASSEKNRQVKVFREDVHVQHKQTPDGKDVCEIFTDMQVCYGSQQTNTDRNFAINGNVVFTNAFEKSPEILFSTVGVAGDWDTGYALFAGNATNAGANFQGIETTRGRGAAGLTVTVTYMAIGKPAKAK
jgi:hypothetical protein